MRAKILIVDDEAAIRFGMRDFLESQGFEVVEADGCATARAVTEQSHPDVALIDFRLHDGDALGLMPQLREISPDLPVLILTAYGSIDLAVQAIKEGAEQFLTKPVELPALLVMLGRVLDNRRVRRKQRVHAERDRRHSIDPFIGDSAAIRQLEAQARRLLGTTSPILIQGETGTGKSLLAGWLHANGPRGDENFVDLNCAGLVREFLETELFGHVKGAFTGAISTKQGLLEIGDRGTLFLDEVGDMDPQIQPKLLKVLEEKRFRRLGELHDRKVDVSLIAATHQDLGAAMREGRFRSDLYYRINTLPLRVPALRERVEDIEALARSILSRISAETGEKAPVLTTAALDAMRRYHWPGNIRELRNTLDRAALLCEDQSIRPRDMHFDEGGAVQAAAIIATEPVPARPEPALSEASTIDDVVRNHIERVLAQEQGRVDAAARRLGIPRSSLYQKLKVYGLSASRFQTARPDAG